MKKCRRKRFFSFVTFLVLFCFLHGNLHAQSSGRGFFVDKVSKAPNSTQQALSNNAISSQSNSARPNSFCLHQVSGLNNLLQQNESKHQAAVAFKEVVKPIFTRFKDLTPEELRNIAQNDPQTLRSAIDTPAFEQTFNTFHQQLWSFERELDRVLQNTSAPSCYPALSKDLHSLAALYFQQGLDKKVSPALTSSTRKLHAPYADHYVIADQIPFNIMKSSVDGQCGTAKQGLQELALYLAGASSFDMAIFEKGLYVVLSKMKLKKSVAQQVSMKIMPKLFSVRLRAMIVE